MSGYSHTWHGAVPQFMYMAVSFVCNERRWQGGPERIPRARPRPRRRTGPSADRAPCSVWRGAGGVRSRERAGGELEPDTAVRVRWRVRNRIHPAHTNAPTRKNGTHEASLTLALGRVLGSSGSPGPRGFDPFASVSFTKTFYTSLRPQRQKLLKTCNQYVSLKNFQITHRGRRYREAFYDKLT